jgi:hypothetical protein
MKKIIKGILISLAAILAVGGLASCSDADVASENLSRDADNFKIVRRVVFFNGITDKYLLTIEGYCSLGNADDPGELTVTCKVGDGQYKKHFLGLSDNVSYFVEQMDSAGVSVNHYKIVFKPSTVAPEIEVR